MLLKDSYAHILIVVLFAIILSCLICNVSGSAQLIYAINAGGDAHTDSYGIKYEKDPLQGRIGIASDYGKRLLIGRVPPNDYILYQTERYHTDTFGYDIPVSADGEYVLILKFCEVYFNAPDQKVFDVVLNGDHTIVADLDIYDKVGKGVAHDEYVAFKINKGQLLVNGEESEIQNGKIRVDFIKGYKDNPKINALYVVKGKLDDVPKLPPIPVEPSLTPPEQTEKEEEVEDIPRVRPRASGPKQPDPYSEDDSSIMLPVFIAIGAFIPVLFCLCRL